MRDPCSVVARRVPCVRPTHRAIPAESCPAKCQAPAPYPDSNWVHELDLQEGGLQVGV